VAEARRLAYWGQLVYFVFFFILLVFGLMALVFGTFSSAAYLIISAVVNLIIVLLLKATVFDAIDQGRFSEASDRMLIWGILGIVFGILPGIFLVIAFIKIQEVFQPQYQPYPPYQYQGEQQYPGSPPSQYPPQQYPQEPPRARAPGEEPAAPQASRPTQSKQKPEMVKCKKCGVQYPGFMRSCPNCGEPR